MMSSDASQAPCPYLPTAVTSDVVNYLPLCLPSQPSGVAGAAAAGAGADSTSPALLHAVCGALLAADISNLLPRVSVAQLAPQPGTLEHMLVELNPLVFRNQPVPHTNTNTSPAGQPQPKAAGKSKAARATAAAAAAGATTADEVPAEQAAKRRKTVAPSSQEFVARVVDPQQVAADVAEQISSFMQRASAMDSSDAGAAAAEPAAAGRRGGKSAGRAAASAQQQAPVTIDSLKQLQSSLASGKQAGILSQLDQEQLRQLLLLLLDHVRLGQDQLIQEQDMASAAAVQQVSTALEAACCCMQVLSAPSMHNSLYIDELVTAAVNLAKFHLQYNVLALHDPHYKRLYRPDDVQEAAPATTGKRKTRESMGARAPKVLADVRAKLELLLALIAQMVERIMLEVQLLLPLVRVALTCLSVDSLQLLQAQAVALTVSVFKTYPQQRSSLADEVHTTVLATMHISGKAPARLFEATAAGLEPLPVMMATALITQLVQVSVELPDMEAEPGAIHVGFKAAYGWSDYLWQAIFARLPAAKAVKTEGGTDFKLVVQALLADLLTVQMLPEWPAANILLRRFLKQLVGEAGLKHKDAAVKLACVDFAGQLAAGLCQEALCAEQEADEVQALKEAALAAADTEALQGSSDQLQLVTDLLLLDYLSTWGLSSSSSSSAPASARRFMCCRMLHDELHVDPGAPAKEPAEVTLLLVQHRRLQDSQLPLLGAVPSALQLSRSQVVSLQRQWALRGPLGHARFALIRWLLEAGSRQGPDPSPATVRTKVFKCLGSVVGVDSRVMAMTEVMSAVQAAQEDDSAAVKEAVLELLVKLIGTNPELAGEYFDTLVNASYDSGVSVRKRAIRALMECCSCPGFGRADDAVVAVLQRANDKEDSMRVLVTKICGEMWFSDASSFAGLAEDAAPDGTATTRTANIRAAELAAVCLRLYETGGKAIHVPLAPDNGLIVIFREVLGTGSSSSAGATPSAKELKEQAAMREGAAEVAQSLLGMVLQQHQEESADDGSAQGGSAAGGFQYLLALHALTAADPRVAAPAADAQRFVRCLAPYVAELSNATAPQAGRQSATGANGTTVEDANRRAAEQGLCLLAVLDAVLSHLGCVEQEVAQQLSTDLLTMLNKTRFIQVVAAGCQLLCTLARLHKPAAGHVTQLANRCYSICSAALSSGQHTPGAAGTLQHAPRVLYLLGQLCRHGAGLLDAAAASDTSSHNCAECLELCVSLWYKRDVSDALLLQRLREGALTAVGLIIIGQPALMLQSLTLGLLEHQHSSGATATGTTATSAHSGGSADAGSPEPDQQQLQRQLRGRGSGAALQGLGSGVSVVRVYSAVLSEPHMSMAVKGKVLISLVDLLRSEEATLLARQKETEAAGTAARLPSTQHHEAKALAKVNGEADAAGGSASSSIIQCVWQHVLGLATGVSRGGSGGGAGSSGSGLPPHTPNTAAVLMEAANTRRRALELIEVVLRNGLVAPWDAVPPLVAQLTDELPDTRAAALKVLKGAAEKYTEFVGNNLAPGVLEAFSFQSRLWAAKHPGQPLPKAPSPEVLEGLSAMYSEVVQPAANMRHRFLTSLLKPFDTATNITASQAAAAREEPSRLAFCAYVAANMPYKRADEPLVLLHAINACVTRSAQEVRDVLRRALLRLGLQEQLGLEDEEEGEQEAAAAAGATSPHQHAANNAAAAAAGGGDDAAADAASPQHHQHHQQQHHQQQHVSLPLPLPLPQWLAAPLKASLGLSMLLVLKQYLMAAYGLSDERVAAYELKGEKARAEAKALVSRSRRTGEFSLSVLQLRAVADGTGELLAEQFKTFAALLDNDAANYKEMAVLAALADTGDDEDADGDAAAAAAGGGKQPTATPAVAAGLVVYSTEVKGRGSRAGGAAKGAATTGAKAGRGGSRGKGRSTGRAATTGRGAKKAKPRSRRRSAPAGDSSEEEGDGGASEGSDEDWGSSKPAAKARKLFH